MAKDFNRHGLLLGLAGRKREPWYDSAAACVAGIFVLLLFFAFGIIGIIVATGKPGYPGLVWIPGIVCLLSAIALASVITRLFARRFSGSHKGL